MKKAVLLFVGIIFILSSAVVAQDEYYYDDEYTYAEYDADDAPYLDDDDIAAIEMILPEDVPEEWQESPRTAGSTQSPASNEMPRLNTAQTLYHLLVLDRIRSPNSDISGMENMRVLYKYRHGRNGYLIAVYTSPSQGPVFPVLPANSRILVDLATVRRATLREYVNSTAFRRFVTNRRIVSDIQRVLR